MSPSPEHDQHGILAEMRENGSYITGQHIVHQDGTHGEEYLDQNAHLNHPESAARVIQLMAQSIPPGSMIISPETRLGVVLGERIAKDTRSSFFATKKQDGIHTIPPNITQILTQHEGPRILIDTILNNGATFSQVSRALRLIGLKIDAFHVMINENPALSSRLGVPVESLAQIETSQWDETDVPEYLKNTPITTKHGKAQNWVPKGPGEMLAYSVFLERLGKEKLGFTLDDGRKVIQIDQDGYFLQAKEGRKEK